ncbi:MAG: glycosyltransferase family 1 protein [Candidatus Moranbacteria bacterium]|nr:glycosyltransferase family 1 protein [Candidatus Moranbacteria bacterium]MDD3965142.1 glycosyltransferase family 1 protein [Candidatus Moranbacteria bacterium]
MIIGIDASRAFLKRRTGIEEYAYQTIKHLRTCISPTDTVILYVRRKISWEKGRIRFVVPEIDFSLPNNWHVRGVWAPRFWTQIALSLEMLFHTPDVLFVPAHTVPLIHPAHNATFLYSSVALFVRKIFHKASSCTFEHSVAGGPKKTIVTIHGLEYEFCKESYAFLDRLYMRLSIRFSCRVASTVICVSENTKRDVMKLYSVPEKKIQVIYEGYEQQSTENSQQRTKKQTSPYLLFIGRLEERKNIVRMIEAFEILKKKYVIPHILVLAGKPGYGYDQIRYKLQATSHKLDIKELGYISEEEKWALFKNADVFLFPSLYEGFGIPVLEAQSVGVPVVTSDIASLPEVGGAGAIYIDPLNAESLAEGIYRVISDKQQRDDIIAKATENVRRFSWQKCADDIHVLFS